MFLMNLLSTLLAIIIIIAVVFIIFYIGINFDPAIFEDFDIKKCRAKAIERNKEKQHRESEKYSKELQQLIERREQKAINDMLTAYQRGEAYYSVKEDDGTVKGFSFEAIEACAKYCDDHDIKYYRDTFLIIFKDD